MDHNDTCLVGGGGPKNKKQNKKNVICDYLSTDYATDSGRNFICFPLLAQFCYYKVIKIHRKYMKVLRNAVSCTESVDRC